MARVVSAWPRPWLLVLVLVACSQRVRSAAIDVQGLNSNRSELRSISKAHRLHHNIDVLELFSGMSIVFIGDSLTRYQYLNFVTFLYTNRWVLKPPVNEIEHIFSSWEEFYAISSGRLGGYEICDCLRNGSAMTTKENRHFYDPDYKLSVRFFWWVALPIEMNRMYRPNDFVPSSMVSTPLPLSVRQTVLSTYPRIEDFLTEQIHPLNATFLVFNFGLWSWATPEIKHEWELVHTVRFDNFTTALKRAARFPIWKTTTCIRRDNVTWDDPPAFQQRLKDRGMHIFDAHTLTLSYLDGINYWDAMHYFPHVYKDLNIHLMSMFVKLLFS